jgi:hypothetical protein
MAARPHQQNTGSAEPSELESLKAGTQGHSKRESMGYIVIVIADKVI